MVTKASRALTKLNLAQLSNSPALVCSLDRAEVPQRSFKRRVWINLMASSMVAAPAPGTGDAGISRSDPAAGFGGNARCTVVFAVGLGDRLIRTVSFLRFFFRPRLEFFGSSSGSSAGALNATGGGGEAVDASRSAASLVCGRCRKPRPSEDELTTVCRLINVKGTGQNVAASVSE